LVKLGSVDGVTTTPLKIIELPNGNVLQSIKKDDIGFCGFGECYFSYVNYDAIKAWKRHKKMTLNLTVPIGKIKFVIYDDRKESFTNGLYQEIILTLSNYHRLTIPPKCWFGFQGLDKKENLLLNVANIVHDPEEVDRKMINEFDFDWSK